MPIAIITGSGTYALPGFESADPEPVSTDWGDALVTRGVFAGTEVLHVSRHGEGHRRLSNVVTHRANIAALAQLGASAVIAVTVCGAVDPDVELGSVACFDDLHFLANRLGDGQLCTFYSEPGDRAARALDLRGPVLGAAARRAARGSARRPASLSATAACTGTSTARASTPARRSAGWRRAASRTSRRPAAPRPCCAARPSCRTRCSGYATDYANGVKDEATPVQTLLDMMAASTETFADAARRGRTPRRGRRPRAGRHGLPLRGQLS